MKPPGYDSPTALPADDQSQADWQQRNKSWWEAHPMRYDWKESLGTSEFSKEFYIEIDRRFFESASLMIPPKERPFDALIPFDELSSMDVLEIGVGNGSHAQLIAPQCKSYTGIDLTKYAVESTTRRLKLFGVNGTIRQMDAERMEFADRSFDFIWTWGVIHHSANTREILSEMARVLRPGGRAVVMVYNRSFYLYYVCFGLVRGVFLGGLLKHSLHEIVQGATDGAIARYYSANEWRTLVEPYFHVEDIRGLGQKSELFPMPAGKLKNALMSIVPSAASRFVLNRCGQGSFLVSRLRKRERT